MALAEALMRDAGEVAGGNAGEATTSEDEDPAERNEARPTRRADDDAHGDAHRAPRVARGNGDGGVDALAGLSFGALDRLSNRRATVSRVAGANHAAKIAAARRRLAQLLASSSHDHDDDAQHHGLDNGDDHDDDAQHYDDDEAPHRDGHLEHRPFDRCDGRPTFAHGGADHPTTTPLRRGSVVERAAASDAATATPARFAPASTTAAEALGLLPASEAAATSHHPPYSAMAETAAVATTATKVKGGLTSDRTCVLMKGVDGNEEAQANRHDDATIDARSTPPRVWLRASRRHDGSPLRAARRRRSHGCCCCCGSPRRHDG